MRLLEGAWDRVPEIAARYDMDAVCLKETCEDYVRELLVAGVAHEWGTTSSVLLRAPCLTDAS